MRLSKGLRSSLVGVHHKPESLSHLNLFQLPRVHIPPADKPRAAIRVHVDGFNEYHRINRTSRFWSLAIKGARVGLDVLAEGDEARLPARHYSLMVRLTVVSLQRTSPPAIRVTCSASGRLDGICLAS